MKRWLRGPVVLAAAVGLWSCSGDPTDSFRGGASSIVASPSSIFLSEGETKEVLVQATDEQGNTLPVTFETSVGAGITVVEDTAFLPTNGAGPVEGTTRYLVTAGAPVSTSFIVSADGVADTIPVRILPLSFPGTFSNAAPAVGEVVVVTAPAGFTFTPEATVALGADTATVVGVAADGSTLSFIASPAATGIPAFSGLALDFLPGLPLSLPATTTVTVASAVTPLAGTDDPGTAPSLTVPDPGFAYPLFDAPDFGAAADRFYKLVVPADGDYTISMDWSVGSDIDMFVCSEAGVATFDCNFSAATGDKPESAVYALTAGTWFIVVEDFGGDAGVSTLKIIVAR